MKVRVPGGKLKLDTGLGERILVPSMYGMKVIPERESRERPGPPPASQVVRTPGQPIRPPTPARLVYLKTGETRTIWPAEESRQA